MEYGNSQISKPLLSDHFLLSKDHLCTKTTLLFDSKGTLHNDHLVIETTSIQDHPLMKTTCLH